MNETPNHLEHIHVSKPNHEGIETITITEWFPSKAQAQPRIKHLKALHWEHRVDIGTSCLGKVKVTSWHDNDTTWKDED